MIEITEEYIPKLNDHLSIIQFDQRSFLICVDSEQPAKLKISAVSKLLIDQIDGKRNISDIAQSFNDQTGANLSLDMVMKIFSTNFIGFGVLKNDGTDKIRVKDNYLKLRIKLFNENLVRRMAEPILSLFSKTVFLNTLLICSVFLGYVFIQHLNLKQLYAGITPSFSLWFIALNILSILFHELGHAGACQRFGARSGPIGFGFYLFTPVFYADVSDAWRLKREERLIVDLAGIYMQIIFCSIFGMIYLITGDTFYLHISFLITTTIIVNINPFLRYDGYWALCDLINLPNLRENSLKQMKQFFRKMIGKENSWKTTSVNVFLVAYSMSTITFILYFLSHMLINKQNSILYFPANVVSFFRTIITNFPDITFQWIKDSLAAFFLPALFYLFAYRIVIKPFYKFIKRKL